VEAAGLIGPDGGDRLPAGIPHVHGQGLAREGLPVVILQGAAGGGHGRHRHVDGGIVQVELGESAQPPLGIEEQPGETLRVEHHLECAVEAAIDDGPESDCGLERRPFQGCREAGAGPQLPASLIISISSQPLWTAPHTDTIHE
jgi:hypothetical protein